jgi:hypothetical protein
MDPAALYDASRAAPGPAAQPAPAPAPPAGGDPSQGGAPPPSPVAQTQNAPEPPTTGMEKATAAASGDGSQNDGNAVSFQVPWEGDQKRDLTPAQIKSTFDRYSSLNYAHSQLKPVLDIIGPMLKGANGDVGKVSEFLKAALQSTQKDPTMGNTGGAQPAGPRSTGTAVPAASGAANLGDFEKEIADWEDENGIKLPGSVKAQSKTISALSGQISALVDMVKHMATANKGQLDAAKDAHGDARNTMVQAIKRQIAQNLDAAQSHHGLPNDAVHDFMTFMGQRGYTMEDMVDPRLAHNVVADFKANLATPEMERLKQITQRRLAATGSLQPAAAGGGGPAVAANGAAPGGVDPDLARLTDMAHQRRSGFNLQ